MKVINCSPGRNRAQPDGKSHPIVQFNPLAKSPCLDLPLDPDPFQGDVPVWHGLFTQPQPPDA